MTSALRVVDSGPGAPAWNMALDEALLATSSARGQALLRFYAWTAPAATFGYSQRHADVERLTRLRPLVRRPTGGGIVPHDRDWTYSLSVPPGSPWHKLSAVDSYRAIHAWIVAAFAALGVTAELAPCCRKELPGQCFVGWEKFDVLWGGRKIGGAAQRRNRLGLLIQGSIQPPPGIPRSAWQAAMKKVAPSGHFPTALDGSIEEATLAAARTLEHDKYSRPEYNAAR